MAPKSKRQKEAVKAEAGNPSGGNGGGQFDHPSLFLAFESMSKDMFPDPNYNEILETRTPEIRAIFRITQLLLRQDKGNREFNKLYEDHVALKDSYEQLQRTSDADKEKIRHLEKNLDDPNGEFSELLEEHVALKNSHEQLQRASDADKEKISDLKKNLEEYDEVNDKYNELVKKHVTLKNSYEQLQKANDAEKERMKDLEEILEDLRAQLEVVEGSVIKAREGASLSAEKRKRLRKA